MTNDCLDTHLAPGSNRRNESQPSWRGSSMSARARTLLIAAVCFLAGALTVQTFTNLHAQQPPPPEAKKPTWQHGMTVKARKAAEATFADAQRFGIEVFRDENTGNLIYISETGSIAVVPERAGK